MLIYAAALLIFSPLFLCRFFRFRCLRFRLISIFRLLPFDIDTPPYAFFFFFFSLIFHATLFALLPCHFTSLRCLIATLLLLLRRALFADFIFFSLIFFATLSCWLSLFR